MTAEEKEERQLREQSYDTALIGKSEDELLAVNYFYKGIKKKMPVVSDEQFDELVSRRASEITSQGVLAALGLSAPPAWIIDPLKVCTPEFDDAEYVRMGADDKTRTSRITTTFLLYASDVMYIYSRTLSLTDRYTRELTASLLYKDITSVALRSVITEELHTDETGKKPKQVWVPGTVNHAIFTVPGQTYEVNVGGAKTVMTAAIARLRAKIAESKR